MANVPQKTLGWLWDVLRREYHDPNRTYSDLAHTLSRHPSFAPRTDVYTSETGAHALLVHLRGTVAVTFRGATYRFPIAIWMPHGYPHEPPMLYVTPTDDMVVRPGQHVAGDGRVYHHYLAHWRDAWDRSNVVDLLAILSDIFAKEPPVVSKQQAGRPILQQPPQRQQPHPPPRPPLPHQEQPPPWQPSNRNQQPGPPPPPPKQLPAQDGRTPSPVQARPGRYDAPPPLPPQPQRPGRPLSIYGQSPPGNGTIPQPHPAPQYVPQRVNSLRQQPPQYHQPHSQPPPSQAQILSPQGQAPPPNHVPQPSHHLHHQHHQPSHHFVQPQARHPHLPPANQPQKPLQTSLLDSPFDIPLPVAQQDLPAPPIPRNPEKDALLSHLSSILTSTLHSQISQNASAFPALQSQNAALQSTIPRLQAELSSLSALQETLKSNISLLQSSMSTADSTISSARHRSAAGDIPKVDDMLVPPHVVGKQLYDTVTEERGVEAAILALQEAFVRGRVSSEIWSRRTRELAREGFRKRYAARKIGRGMGLET